MQNNASQIWYIKPTNEKLNKKYIYFVLPKNITSWEPSRMVGQWKKIEKGRQSKVLCE